MTTLNERIKGTLASLDDQLESLEEIREGYERTELGNANRFAGLHGDTIKYVPEVNEWFHWNGKRWATDGSGLAVRRFEDVIAAWRAEINVLNVKYAELDDKTSEQAKSLAADIDNGVKWVKACQRRQTIKNSLELAQSRLGITVPVVEFDSKGNFFGVENGVVDLRTSELITGDPAYLLTKHSPVEYNATADCQNWKTFVTEILQGDAEMIAFMQRVVGQAMFGSAGKDKLVIMWGSGQNGKSKFVDTIATILGGYAQSTDPKVLIDNSRQNKEYYMAPLKGARLVLMSETDSGDQLAEGLVKMIVDSGKITGRYPAGRVFEFQPVFTPILCTNNKPGLSSDPAVWRRILLVPFQYKVPDEKKNPRIIEEVFMPEAPGILNWCLEGAREYLRVGLAPPKAVVEATESYKSDQDNLGQFLMQECLQGGDYKVPLKDFYAQYKVWCRDNNEEAVSNKDVKDKLIAKGIVVKPSTGNVNFVFGYKIDVFMERLKEMVDKRERPQGHLKLVE